jgi:hypothetical protein
VKVFLTFLFFVETENMYHEPLKEYLRRVGVEGLTEWP